MDIHMGGLISGIDAQGFVDKLVVAKSQPIEVMQNEQVELRSDVAAWSNVSSLMSTLADAMNSLRDWDTWNQMDASSSNTAQLTSTADSTAIEATYDIIINNLAEAHSISSSRADVLGIADASTDLVGSVLTAGHAFSIEGVTFTVGQDEYGQTLGGTETLASIKDKINNASDQGVMNNAVTASILDNRLVITRNDTGSTQISMVETTGNPLQDLEIFSAPATYNAANELIEAVDASFSVNGASITRSNNTNLTDVIENVTINLHDVASDASNLTLTISQDTATPKAAIQQMVSSYNAVANALDNYTEIELNGEEDPDVGELQGDLLANSIINNLRKQVTSVKSPHMNSSNAAYNYNGNVGVMDSLEDIGVWTSGKDNNIGIADETRLDAVLANNFDEVEQLFRGVDSGGGAGYEHGVAEDFYNYAYNVSKPITGDIAQRIFNLEDRVDDIDDSITDVLNDIYDYEKRLWQQFTAMEDAVAGMQQELSWLTSQLGM